MNEQLVFCINALLAEDGSQLVQTGEGRYALIQPCGRRVEDVDLMDLLSFILGVNPSAMGEEARS